MEYAYITTRFSLNLESLNSGSASPMIQLIGEGVDILLILSHSKKIPSRLDYPGCFTLCQNDHACIQD